MKAFKGWKPVVVCLVSLLLVTNSAAGCPRCKEAIESDSTAGASVAEGYSRSIILMMVMPFILLGSGAFAVFRLAKRGGIPQL